MSLTILPTGSSARGNREPLHTRPSVTSQAASSRKPAEVGAATSVLKGAYPTKAMRFSSPRLLFLIAGLALLVTIALWQRNAGSSREAAPPSPDELRRLAAQLTALEAREQQAAETHWAPELVAQQCGTVFETLWDALNAVTNKLAVAARFDAGKVVLPRFAQPRRLPHQIALFDPTTSDASEVPATAWSAQLLQFAAAGWELAQCEFRHHRFTPNPQGQPQESLFWFSAHLNNSRRTSRATLSGDLRVEWSVERDADGLPRPERVDASQLQLLTRSAPPAFERVLYEIVTPPPKSHFIDPLILNDRDGDGTNEVILASANALFRWRGTSFSREAFCHEKPGLIFTGVIADFDQDDREDFLCARFEGLVLFRSDEAGVLLDAGESVWSAPARLRYGQVLTTADVDGDGDLDVWLGQYKNPYDGGQMPTPFYDANDGHPSYLLLNDGRGRFTDATERAGLIAKRHRRTYSASLTDLDSDGDADLVVVSDFAGVDLHVNDGRGRFQDTTASCLEEPRAFGMSHALADFDLDGQLDLLVTGMHCSTALRLDALKLSRPERPDYSAMRERMVRGNRLWRGAGKGQFVESPAAASIAHSGWSWGCAAGDFDNDGFPDVYITNGHETRQQTRDYDAEFWLHDIYAGTSKEDPVVLAYFTSKLGRTRGHGMSYGGYEKNRLYLNLAGREFIEVAHLFGVAVEQDSRNLVVEDFDGDGRVDLIFTTFEVWPRKQQTVQVWRNVLPDIGNWVALRPGKRVADRPDFGGRVILTVAGRETPRMIVTGDSHRSQQSRSVHFGLGTNAVPPTLRILAPHRAPREVDRLTYDGHTTPETR